MHQAQYTEKDASHRLHWAPSLGSSFIPHRIVAGGMEDGYADIAVGIDWYQRDSGWDLLFGWSRGGSKVILKGLSG
jgi:hypothetical protein